MCFPALELVKVWIREATKTSSCSRCFDFCPRILLIQREYTNQPINAKKVLSILFVVWFKSDPFRYRKIGSFVRKRPRNSRYPKRRLRKCTGLDTGSERDASDVHRKPSNRMRRVREKKIAFSQAGPTHERLGISGEHPIRTRPLSHHRSRGDGVSLAPTSSIPGKSRRSRGSTTVSAPLQMILILPSGVRTITLMRLRSLVKPST